MPLAQRTQRAEARLLPEQKERIERAARLKGVSLSDFMVQNADEAPSAPSSSMQAGRSLPRTGTCLCRRCFIRRIRALA
jgi:hypothetical protein